MCRPGALPAGGDPHPDPGPGGAPAQAAEHAKGDLNRPGAAVMSGCGVDWQPLRSLGGDQQLVKEHETHHRVVVVDRLVVKEEIRSRLADSLETALGLTRHTIVEWSMSSGG